LRVGDSVTTSGFEGEVVGRGRVVAIHQAADQDRRRLIYVETPADEVDSVAGLRMWEPAEKRSPAEMVEVSDDEIIICRCERVTKRRIKELIQNGCNDFNALKAELRVGMGACGGKTCTDLIWRIFMECGVELGEVGQHVHRPFEQEVPLKAFIKGDD
jgi:NAD(P)H-nitrite reductase large subunit